MENNEQEVQETEQITAPDAEETKVETKEGDEDTKDWKAEALKYKAIAERKEKKLQKEGSENLNKPKTDQTGLSREEAIFFAKGGSEEDLAVAKKVAEIEGISILAAMEDDYYKSQVEKREKEAEALKGGEEVKATPKKIQPKPY